MASATILVILLIAMISSAAFGTIGVGGSSKPAALRQNKRLAVPLGRISPDFRGKCAPKRVGLRKFE
jgi:hypothetical protein